VRANGGDRTERDSIKVEGDRTSVTAKLAITVPGITCEQQQKQSSSSEGRCEGSFVG